MLYHLLLILFRKVNGTYQVSNAVTYFGKKVAPVALTFQRHH